MLMLGRLWLSESSLGSKFSNVLNLDTMSLTLVLWRREHLILEPFPDRSSSFLELFSASAVCVATVVAKRAKDGFLQCSQ